MSVLLVDFREVWRLPSAVCREALTGLTDVCVSDCGRALSADTADLELDRPPWMGMLAVVLKGPPGTFPTIDARLPPDVRLVNN